MRSSWTTRPDVEDPFVDLFEYQAPISSPRTGSVLDAIVADTSQPPARRPSNWVAISSSSRPGEDRWPGKAGGVKLAKTRRSGREGWRDPRYGIKGHTVHRVLVAKAADIARSTTSRLLDRPTAPTWRWPPASGMEIEQLAEERPDASPRSRWTRWRDRPGEGRRDRRGRGFPAELRMTSPTRS